MFQPAVTKTAVAKRQEPRPPREVIIIMNTVPVINNTSY